MDYLSRESAPFSDGLWQQIDETVVNTARKTLVGRKFIHIYGPLGAETLSVPVADPTRSGAKEQDGPLIKTPGRAYRELPLIHQDATLYWRDLQNSIEGGLPLDLSAVAEASAQCARHEDELIFFGNKAFGYDGLLTAPGASHIQRSDWISGENPFSDIAKGLELLMEKGVFGRSTLVVSPNLYTQLNRIQSGTGKTELERIGALLDGHVLRTPVLGADKAVLVCAQPQYMDLAVGQDFAAAYLELKDLNHVLRIVETALLRIKRSDAIVIFD
ncbi:MAG: family 1 encapsulin nanocompartment shell protein [Christensenellales bacterium]|jgi:uncharacterized linocin/CFP29 family protein